MAITAAIGTAVIVGGTTAAVQSNQQKIAAQKQKDALGDAEKAQQKLVDEQKQQDLARKAKEAELLQAGFAKSAAARTRNTSNLPGAVTSSQSIGNVVNPAAPGAKLIGG